MILSMKVRPIFNTSKKDIRLRNNFFPISVTTETSKLRKKQYGSDDGNTLFGFVTMLFRRFHTFVRFFLSEPIVEPTDPSPVAEIPMRHGSGYGIVFFTFVLFIFSSFFTFVRSCCRRNRRFHRVYEPHKSAAAFAHDQ